MTSQYSESYPRVLSIFFTECLLWVENILFFVVIENLSEISFLFFFVIMWAGRFSHNISSRFLDDKTQLSETLWQLL